MYIYIDIFGHDIQSLYITASYLNYSVTSKLHSIMENEECRKYSKNVFKKSESKYKSLYHIELSCFWKSVNRFGCYRRGSFRKKVKCFPLGTPLKNSRMNDEAVLKIWTINAAIYSYRNTVRNFFLWWTVFGKKYKILILIWHGCLKWQIILRSLREGCRKQNAKN